MSSLRTFAGMLELTVANTRITKPRKMTLKQRRFLKEYVKTGNATRSAMTAYPNSNYKTASVIAVDNLKKVDIITIFDKAGLTDDAIAQTINEARSATKENGKPDWLPRLKATEMALKVRGHFKERIEHTGSVGVYPILGGLSKAGAGEKMIEGVEVAHKSE